MDLHSSVKSKEKSLVHKIETGNFTEKCVTDMVTGSNQQISSLRIPDANDDAVNGISLSTSWSQHSDYMSSPINIVSTPCAVAELSHSHTFDNNTPQKEHLLNVSQSDSNQTTPHAKHYKLHGSASPTSPLLIAMRSAVDSLNKYEDFKILEMIGVGFFAEVFKVSLLVAGLTFELMSYFQYIWHVSR